ncbi:MAG: Peptidoglycan-binding domain 1 protein [Citricoccus sp.]|nr:Peptidoglycan-binding domain 1 protein [Citricoccus sp. WCRC_4]
MAVYVGYEGAKNCTDGPQPGSRGMMQWFLENYRHLGGTNLGIYNCRTVRGGSTTSLHGEGRAVDLGINPHGAAYGTDLAERLRNSSKEIGIQCIIWNRKIWSGAHPNSGWRNYGGRNDHVDHLHVELSWAAAKKNSSEVITLLNTHLATEPDAPQPPETPSPTAPYPTQRRGDTGALVEEIQTRLNRYGFAAGPEDGVFGAGTEAAVKRFQDAVGTGVDGIVGSKTWAALLTREAAGHTLRKGSSGEEVQHLQRGLRAAVEHGLAVDGQFDVATEDAVKKYQQSRGLSDDGIVGPKTWEALQGGR